MINPVVTYRIQFHKDFTFRDLIGIIPYLHSMGIRTIYASPIFEAAPGSMHGYDIVNPHRINPEIGTLEDLQEISTILKRHNMYWIQDIVPNHMAFHSANEWLMDVLEKGRNSVYASFFDLAWTSELFTGRIIVPFLSEPLDNLITTKEIRLAYSQQRFVVTYHKQFYPLKPRSYAMLLKSDDAPDAVQQLLEQISNIHQTESPIEYALQWHELLLQIAALQQVPEIKNYITSALDAVNNDSDKLIAILDEQNYSLTSWQVTDNRINFRRFFTVNELIGLNMHHERVFRHYHQFILDLLQKQIFQGLRIDHIDGLYDPSHYLQSLRDLAGPDVYIVAEKIVHHNESLPPWPVQGLTGYEFLAQVNQVMAYPRAEKILSSFYRTINKEQTPAAKSILDKKRYILKHHMQGELRNLTRLFVELFDKNFPESISSDDVQDAIAEFLIQFPVYRFYGNQFPLAAYEAESVLDVLSSLDNPKLAAGVNLLRQTLIDPQLRENQEQPSRVEEFYKRLMQFTGPLTAKGVEDTFFYTYNRFIAHNEVGDSPTQFGLDILSFHNYMEERQRKYPLALNASATHDTKRGEDVRNRLLAFSSIPDKWVTLFKEWIQTSKHLASNNMPDGNDRYFILQTIVGALPPSPDSFPERLQEYLVKAFREAKRHTNWNSPNEVYEQATKDFVAALFEKTDEFISRLTAVAPELNDYGYLNSLAMEVLKFTCPGVPDIYQGCERWDFSLVDPDNRRPVDYEGRASTLDEITSLSSGTEFTTLWKERTNGKVKQFLVRALAIHRTQNPELFRNGDYVPLQVQGKYKNLILAFARVYQSEVSVSIVPLFAASLAVKQNKPVSLVDWHDTRVLLPKTFPLNWSNIITGKQGTHAGELAVNKICEEFPLGVLAFKFHQSDRSAGILMHISSLPGKFSIGDLGPSAYGFADFLARARQSWWQLLPLNPTDAATGHSPYSSYSSMAGNPLFISPELLADEGYLEKADNPYSSETKVNYDDATKIKNELLHDAWDRFQVVKNADAEKAFLAFTDLESYWLDDFALYVTLKSHFQGAAWHTWPDKFRDRSPVALEEFKVSNASQIQYVKWLQFIFSKQWKALREYCYNSGIRLIGDLPFYIIHDSVDVWTRPELFSLGHDKNPMYVGGVPPDYFNDAGQLWGMPVFKWDVHKTDGYSWWTNRLRRNIELFDIVRLDHFRAFSEYWQVHASEASAVNGEWRAGGGLHFFQAMKAALGHLPFIAEDLGEITDDVYRLRDTFELPGMKVLQFAFGPDLANSPHAPHNAEKNFIIYTGTHDNNTVVGWFHKDINSDDRRRLRHYTGQHTGRENIAEIMIRMAYASVCNIAIVPIQDVLGYDESARMNFPGLSQSNWIWRLEKLPSDERADYLSDLTVMFRRT